MSVEESTKSKRGGAREGAGRKSLKESKKKQFQTISISKSLALRLKATKMETGKSYTKIIEESMNK